MLKDILVIGILLSVMMTAFAIIADNSGLIIFTFIIFMCSTKFLYNELEMERRWGPNWADEFYE